MALDLEFKNTTSDYTGTGAGLAGRLTSAQADNNSWLIKQAVEALQAASGKTISGVTAVGNQMTITYTDATTDVITLPNAQFTWRGEWLPDTLYTIMDIITGPDNTGDDTYAGNIYLVVYTHTSESTTDGFDPGYQVDSNDCYSLMMQMPSGVLPIGGSDGQFLAKASATDYDVEWITLPPPAVQTQSGATFTPALTDANTYNRCTNAGGCTVTLPENSGVAFAVDTEIHFCQAATNVVAFEAPTAVTLNYPTDCNPNTGIQYGVVTLKKVATDEWDLFGRLEVTSA